MKIKIRNDVIKALKTNKKMKFLRMKNIKKMIFKFIKKRRKNKKKLEKIMIKKI